MVSNYCWNLCTYFMKFQSFFFQFLTIAICSKDNGESKIEEKKKSQILYGIDDIPPWYLCVPMAFQVITKNCTDMSCNCSSFYWKRFAFYYLQMHWDVFFEFISQHYLTMIGAIVSIPFILTPALCMENDDPARGQIISTMIFVTGIVTYIQATWGCRLPIVQVKKYFCFLLGNKFSKWKFREEQFHFWFPFWPF